jgi:hypothetical protein
MIRKLAGGLLTLALMGTTTPCAASDMTGFGGVGFGAAPCSSGPTLTIASQDLPRLTGELVMSYNWSDHLTADITVGWDWSQLDSGTDSFFIANVVPLFPIGIRYKFQDGKKLRPFVGGRRGLIIGRSCRTTWARPRIRLPSRLRRVGFRRLRDRGGRASNVAAHQHDGGWKLHAHLCHRREPLPSGYSGAKAYVQVRLGVTFCLSPASASIRGSPNNPMKTFANPGGKLGMDPEGRPPRVTEELALTFDDAPGARLFRGAPATSTRPPS